jgi:hypothetical protein
LPDSDAILKADVEDRFCEALGLDEEATIEQVRGQEIQLCHRYRHNPDVVAALHHAAEAAVESRNTRLDIADIVAQLKQTWQPDWCVPSSDYAAFLGTRFHLDRLVEHHVRLVYNSTGQCGKDLAAATLRSTLGFLKQQRPKLRNDMADWYCNSATKERERIFGHLKTVASISYSTLRVEIGQAIEELEGPVSCWVGHALRLAPDRTEIKEFQQTVMQEIAKLREFPATVSQPVLRTRKRTAPGFWEQIGGCLLRLVMYGAILGAISGGLFLCSKCAQ